MFTTGRGLRGGAIALLLATSACATQPPRTLERPDQRARFVEAAAAQEFADCREQGLQLDGHARRSGQAAQYLASARILASCEAALAEQAVPAAVEVTERMQILALSIQNHAKGGDIQQAREYLRRFEQTFAGQDLYYDDGTAFTETMALVLGLTAGEDAGQLSLANVGPDLKTEMRRVQYWLDR